MFSVYTLVVLTRSECEVLRTGSQKKRLSDVLEFIPLAFSFSSIALEVEGPTQKCFHAGLVKGMPRTTRAIINQHESIGI